jgi:Tol biopolymer transport system component
VLEQLTSEGISAGKPAVSADGNLLYNSGGALYIRPAGSDTAIRITDQILPSGDMPVFTADGAAVVFAIPRDGEDGSRMHDLYKVPSIGGPPRLFLTEASGAGFSPDGKWVAYTRHLSGRNPLWISPVDALGEHVEVRASGYVPRWSPDGRRIAYTTADPNATSGELWVAAVSRAKSGALQVSDHTRLTSEPQPMYGLSWTPDGRSIVFAARHAGSPMHLYQVPSSGGAVTALTKGAGDYACPSVTPDGTRVIFWQGTGVKDLMVADGLIDAPTRAITEDEFHLWPALSPSGTHIASIVRRPSYEDRLYATEIVVNKRVALSTRAARHPSWVDGDTVAYLEDTSSGQTAVQLVNLTAGPSPLKLTEFTGHAAWVAVHPQKTSVAVVVKSDEGRQRILLRQADGRRPDRTLSLGAEYEHLRWLPGGSALSWSGPERSADPKSNGIWVVEIEGSAPRRIVADGYGPVWAADGKAVFFSRIRQYSGLWKYDLRDGTETELRQWPETSNEFDIVGERLVLTQQGGRGRIFSMSLER